MEDLLRMRIREVAVSVLTGYTHGAKTQFPVTQVLA